MKIDKIYCINLKERKDRKEKMLSQFQKLNLNVQWIKGRKGRIKDFNPQFKNKGQIGCLKSHYSIINDAILNNYENILIFEDDIIICDDFHERLFEIDKYIPDDWVSIYLAGNCYHEYKDHMPYSQYINEYIRKNNKVFGTFSFILNKKIFKELKHWYKLRLYNVDQVHTEIIQKKYKSYSILPFMCHITLDKSNITGRTDEYLYNRIKKEFKNKIK